MLGRNKKSSEFETVEQFSRFRASMESVQHRAPCSDFISVEEIAPETTSSSFKFIGVKAPDNLIDAADQFKNRSAG